MRQRPATDWLAPGSSRPRHPAPWSRPRGLENSSARPAREGRRPPRGPAQLGAGAIHSPPAGALFYALALGTRQGPGSVPPRVSLRGQRPPPSSRPTRRHRPSSSWPVISCASTTGSVSTANAPGYGVIRSAVAIAHRGGRPRPCPAWVREGPHLGATARAAISNCAGRAGTRIRGPSPLLIASPQHQQRPPPRPTPFVHPRGPESQRGVA